MISVFTSDEKTDNFSEIGLPVFHDISTLYVFICPETPNYDVWRLLKVDPETLNPIELLTKMGTMLGNRQGTKYGTRVVAKLSYFHFLKGVVDKKITICLN